MRKVRISLLIFFLFACAIASASEAPRNPRTAGLEFIWALRDTINSLASARGAEQVTGRLLPEAQKVADQGTLADYPFRTDPAVLEDFFSPEFNLPAKVVGFWTADYLNQQLQHVAAYDLKNKVDLQSFFDLSVEASNLWEQVLACADGDPEAARAAYREGRCLRENLAAFHGRAFNFLQSTNIDAAVRYLERLNPYQIIEMHPLLLQVFEEIVAVWFPTENTNAKVRKWARKNIRTEETSRTGHNILRLLPLLPRFTATPIGLWPTATRAAHAYYLAKFFVLGGSPALMYGPGEEFLRTSSRNPVLVALEWGNPVIWLLKLFETARNGAEGMREIEPPPMAMATKWSDFSTEAGLLRATAFPKVVLEFRKISKIYEFDRKDIFR